jgi:hypothetical protein
MKKQVDASSYTIPRDTTGLGSVPPVGVGTCAFGKAWVDQGATAGNLTFSVLVMRASVSSPM